MQHHFSPRELKRRRFKIKFKIYSAFFLLALLVIGALYIIRQSSLFEIRSLSISGLSDEGEKMELLKDLKIRFLGNFAASFLGENNFLSWPKKIEFSDLKFTRVEIKKNILKRTIAVNAQKRERFGIWCTRNIDISTYRDGERCFWFDRDDGLFLEESPIPEGQIILKISEEREEDPKLGDRILPEDLFLNFKKTFATIKGLNISIREAEINAVLQEMKVTTVAGAKLLFSLRIDPALNIASALTKIFSETPIEKINYIDMTVENKIYLKTR